MENFYYYSNGAQIYLTQDPDHIAVDLNRLQESEHSSAAFAELEKEGIHLRDGLFIVPRRTLSDSISEMLESIGEIQPVFLHDDTMIVVLPEVRVEIMTNPQRKRIYAFLEEEQHSVEVVSDRGERLVLRPTSGRGVDALDLANRLQEQIRPEMAQARFMRVLLRPKKGSWDTGKKN